MSLREQEKFDVERVLFDHNFQTATERVSPSTMVSLVNLPKLRIAISIPNWRAVSTNL